MLRWRDPADGIPVELLPLTPGELEAYLDGNRLETGRPIVPHGSHVLAMLIKNLETCRDTPGAAAVSAPGILMFAASCDLGDSPQSTRNPVASAADGTWKHVTSEPPEQWTQVNFDDRGWLNMSELPLTPPRERDHGRASRLRQLTELGAKGLGPLHDCEQVWVRKRFIVSDEGIW